MHAHANASFTISRSTPTAACPIPLQLLQPFCYAFNPCNTKCLVHVALMIFMSYTCFCC